MLKLDFLEKGPETVSPPHFAHDFLGQMFVMLPNFTA